MSCSSPFVLELNEIIISTNYVIKLDGIFKLASLSIPGFTSLCIPKKVKVCNSWDFLNSKGCDWSYGIPLDCFDWSACAGTNPKIEWGDCTSLEDILLWPDISFSGNASIPMTFNAGTSIEISVDEPAAQIKLYSITINPFVCYLTITALGLNFPLTLPLVVEPITTDGESVLITLASYVVSYVTSGVSYSLTMTISLLFCLKPEKPVGWINLDFDCALTASYGSISETQEFAFIIALDEVVDA